MTSLDLPAPVRTHPRGRTWSWRTGPCVALGHAFELVVEPGGDFRAVFSPLVAPFQAFGRRVDGRVGRYEIVAEEAARLPYTLRYEGLRLASGRNPHDLTGMFAWHLNQSVIRRSVGRFVLLHAAAAVRDGMTVMLPADRDCGKSTTVAGLLREGFDYVTDEAVAVDPQSCRVAPFPKTLTLDPGSWALFPQCRPVAATAWIRQWQVPVRTLGARAATMPVPAPRVIVFPRYAQGASTRLRRLSRGQAVQELARMTFAFPRRPGRNLDTLARVASNAAVARLEIGSLDEAVEAIELLLSETLLENL